MNEFESHPPAAAESGAGDVTGTEGAAAHGAADTAAADEATHAQSATHVLPEGVLPVVAVRDTVLFPGTVFPLAIGRAASIRAVQHAMRLESPIGVLLQRNAETIDPAGGDLHEVGTIANILRYVNAPDGEHHIVVQALQLLPSVPQGLIVAVQSVDSAGALADLVSAYLDVPVGEKQGLLETADLAARIEKVSVILAKRIEVMRLTREIGQRTKATFDERQREAILREQMASIQRELGEEGGKSAEVAELEKAIDAAQMPDAAREIALKELRRYERMSDGAPEAGMVRNYLDWLTELPWAEPEPRPIDIHEARRVLDEDHFGLDKIKQRIIEFLAVRKLAPHGKAPILCFVGPPGVGKTSLGQSIARAMGRPFAHVSLGGVHDEAEIRGHRRTYIGSMPGNIIQAVRKAKARDCVMMLDEIDKMGRGVQGDPSAAMLEVLDPEQNATFRDNYLGVTFDLSRITFITTANMLETIPGPLRDRMEIIELTGYTEEEKVEIARRYLVGRQLKANGLDS